MVKDLVGQRFGKLTVIKQAGYTKVNKWGSRYALWLCKCDCGNDCTMDTGTLTRPKSCMSCPFTDADEDCILRKEETNGIETFNEMYRHCPLKEVQE